jgi:isopentenyl-diphosphate Delta-isomerase
VIHGVFVPDKYEQVVLVDQTDFACGLMEKFEAHQKGLLHRAISIWILDSQGKILLQQRAAKKYHSPLLWANACCSHPRYGEDILDAATRRLEEELGIECTLEKKASFIYRADVGNGLIEHEFDHVFVGLYEGPFVLNKNEVAQVRYVDRTFLQQTLASKKDLFVPWLPHIITACFGE